MELAEEGDSTEAAAAVLVWHYDGEAARKGI